MGEIIKTWMRTRLGVIIDLSPEIFGHYARDGTLLGKLLHSYDIINDNQLSTLNRTQDPALARLNLKNLRIWLRFIGVDFDDDYIEDISNGKGTTALRLFYKVFLCLENKDTLHFITLQKEREKFIPNSSKFDVTTVSEEPELWAPDDHPLVEPLKKNVNLIDWHRKKYRELIDSSKKEKKIFHESQEEKIRLSVTTDKIISSKSKNSIEQLNKELDEFAKKHKIKEDKLLDPCRDIRHSNFVKPPKEDPEAAKAFAKSLKNKHRQEAITKNFKSRMQKNLLSHLWEEVLNDQEMKLDEIVAKKVLDQSQYEKQLMHKLCDIRREKSRMAENRKIVEELSQSKKTSEAILEQERTKEILVRESEEVEAENRRMKELERKINEEFAKKKLLKIQKTGKDCFNDIVEIAIKAVEYKISSNDENIPKSLWIEWKTLFIKNQQITNLNYIKNPEIDLVEEDEEDEEIEEEEIPQKIDTSKNEILKDEDFENYHKLRSPWNDFIPEINIEDQEYLNLGIVVLGYIVHKILTNLHHHHNSPIEVPIPKMKIRTLLVGIPDAFLYEPIRELLKQNKIHLVRMEEAINHCLKQYKSEMQDVEFIDLKIIAATNEIKINKASRSSSEYRKNEQKRENQSASSKGRNESIKKIEQSNELNKLTQTPRVIPYEDMDPCLSDAAYIGKWTHEFLTLGTPLSDELMARIIVEYLKSLKDVDGFVLVNYPNNYQQIKSLEFALSGKKLPEKYEYLKKEEMNIEDIDQISSRISFESEEYDSKNQWIRSRLVPNPIESSEDSDRNSYLTAFIRVKPKSESQKIEDNERYEFLSEDSKSLDAFYADEDIASIFYYKIFDLATLKKLVRLVIMGDDEIFNRKSSTELFDEAMQTFSESEDYYNYDSKAPVVKKLLSRTHDLRSDSFIESDISEWTGRSDETKEEIISRSNRSKNEFSLPGEADWVWANLQQSSQLIESLGILWRNIETSYIENLKDIFSLKRRNFEAIVPYVNFVEKHMNDFIERPDTKQDLLHEFHRNFNNIDEEIREHDEVKYELHCRIADFQMKLWEICNRRRQESEDERKRIIHEHWATKEEINLVNIYIGIIQEEIDRFTGTLNIIQDYYFSMLQRSLQDIQISRIILKKISFDSLTFVSIEEISSTEKISSKSIKEKNIKESKLKISPPLAADENIFKEEMVQLLTEFDEENFDIVKLTAYKIIEANIRYVEAKVESITSSIIDILKKEENNSVKTPIDFKNKKRLSRKLSETSRIEEEATRNRARNLVLEWRYAVMFEIKRIHLRLKILEASARADVNYLVDKIRHLFFDIRQRIIDRFNNEIKSVNEMASTFCLAIEEASPIQEEMLLDGDRFIVRSNVLMFPSKPEILLKRKDEEKFPFKFQMSQISRLIDIFLRVAPSGILPERAFVYIIQDLIACGNEENEMSLLPEKWLKLRACDVSKLVNEIFGEVEFLDWREFIIYSMAIEPPSVEQLLNNFEAFKKIDKNNTNVISYEDFHSVDLWFCNETKNEEKKILENYYEDEKNSEKFRFNFAKKLLGEMFLSKNRTINYVALLLIFCKDDDPKNGLGKALSLATGNKICIDWEEGEKYVNECLMKKKFRSFLRDEAIKTSESIVKEIMKKVVRTIESKSNKSSKDNFRSKEDYKKFERFPIQIEKLDLPGEIVNPADLLPPESIKISSLIEDIEENQNIEETKTLRSSIDKILPEELEKIQRILNDEIRKIIYWLNFDVCQSVLAATLPKHVTQPDLLETGKNIRSNLKEIFNDLRIEELCNENLVLAHRFLEHSFIKKLLKNTNIFSTKNLESIVKKILRN